MKVKCHDKKTNQDHVEISSSELSLCRVCGYDWGDWHPWKDGEYPTYAICPCCFVEAGYEDISIQAIKKYRQEWIDAGAKWAKPEETPDDWSFKKALNAIPSVFK